MSSIDTAIILAAGAGSRLGELTAARPKMFLEIAGRKLIDYQLAHLASRGVTHVIIATGHRHEWVVETMGDRYLGVEIRYAHNESYDSTESAWSLFGCREIWSATPRPVLFLHSDIFYDPAILDLVLASESETVLALDEHYETITKDEVVMTGRGGSIRGIQRGPLSEASEFAGEVVGIHRYSKDYLAGFFDFLDDKLTRSDRAHHYEFLSVEFAESRNHRMSYVSTNRLPWININYREDLEYAADEIYPILAPRNSGT